LSAHTKAIISIAFPENNNSMFLTASRDGTSKLWNMNGELLMNLIGELDAPVNKAVFSPNGKFIMIASNLSYLIYSPTPQFVKSILKRKSLRPFTEEEKIFFNAPNCN
jgi:WD40 repeat protein